VIPSVALIASSSSSTAVTNEVSGSADSFGCSVDELSLSLLSAKALKLDVPC